MTQSMPDETDALLTRLSQKPGVQSTLVLSRDTGAVVRTTGLVSASATPNPNSTLPASSNANPSTVSSNTQTQPDLPDGKPSASSTGTLTAAEELAGRVWTFVSAAGALANGLDGDDEVKLLRLRTKKNELVIVPDPKFLLVVVHDAPPT
ncbi:MAG: hypothetical protein M1833_006252 [Piccolia ochrophora]|nr:MAG: hypothetical protein M1833_006252 [Piccolia ochrophora]